MALDHDTVARLSAAAAQVTVPGTGHTLGALDALVEASVDDARVTLPVALPFACESLWPAIADAVTAALAADPELAGVAPTLQFSTAIPSFGVQRSLKPLPGIRNIVAVASGKGGVGKSTVAANLALALSAEGARVGVLDADIYGPSMPRMLGLIGQQPATIDDKMLSPLEAHGLQVMSIGFLVDEASPMVWRGPMVTSALNQLLRQTAWRDLDVLVVDMPPGTGDIQLTLSQTVPVAGAIIVTTPQDVALSDARKGLGMFRKVNVPVLGIVENMSLYRCPKCGDETSLFGAGGGHRLAEEAGVALLGELPLSPAIRIGVDEGLPSVVADPDGDDARHFRQIAISTGAALATSKKDYSHAFPKIVIEDS